MTTLLRTISCSLTLAAFGAAQDPILYVQSLPPTGPAVLGQQDLDLSIVVPGFAPVEFSTVPIPIPNTPEWSLLSPTPLGPIAVVPSSPEPGEYFLAFENGIVVPVAWDVDSARFLGSDGTVAASVSHSPHDPGDGTDTTCVGPCVDIRVTDVPRPKGAPGFRIEVDHPSECSVEFFQFFRQTITWTDDAGMDHPCPLEINGTGNNERKCGTDGMDVYVDSSESSTGGLSGRYPARPPAQNGPTTESSMEDAPQIKDPEGLAASIAVHEEATVTKLTVFMEMTTYVMLFCPGSVDIVGIVNWTTSREYTIPKPAGGFTPGEVGGPLPPTGECGFPNSSPQIEVGPGLTMLPSHTAALAEYQGQ